MFRLLRLTAILIVLCVGAIGLSRLIGGTQPNPIAAWFTNPDGSACDKPCLFGIQPGVTKYDDIFHILSLHPVTRAMRKQKMNDADPNLVIGLRDDHYCITIWRDPSDTVQYMTVSARYCFFTSFSVSDPHTLTLGQLVSTLGSPDEVGGDRSHTYFFLNGSLSFETAKDGRCRVLPGQNYDLLKLKSGDTRGAGVSAWKGFTGGRIDPALDDRSACHD